TGLETCAPLGRVPGLGALGTFGQALRTGAVPQLHRKPLLRDTWQAHDPAGRRVRPDERKLLVLAVAGADGLPWSGSSPPRNGHLRQVVMSRWDLIVGQEPSDNVRLVLPLQSSFHQLGRRSRKAQAAQGLGIGDGDTRASLRRGKVGPVLLVAAI